ncbi:helix-turn-helix domain-containing protein [Actinomadura hibisca]|uniref:helix-turn-helix domain-containing protein n=1 Tax=Actinomadura hibisca TaxID=68565 RepID=UPI0008367902|nr:helix-turn-helix transcriptional regulator [Actinomadura hibisca]
MAQTPKKLDPSRGPLHLFGAEVRHHRERAGLSLRALAEVIPYGASTISEIERGDAGCDRVFAEVADEVLDTGGALTRLHDGLFDGRSASFPRWFQEWPDHEAGAEILRSYQPLLVDGLLQTEGYASILLEGDRAKVEGRMARQEILSREVPPRFLYLLPEHVLWRRVGSVETMRQQLLRLADAVSPRCSIQVIRDGEPHKGNAAGFIIATMPGGESVAYTAGEPHGWVLDGRSEVARLQERFADLATFALPVALSVELIRNVAEERWKA